MEFLRRPSVPAAAAAAVLAINLVVLAADGAEPGGGVDEPQEQSATEGTDAVAGEGEPSGEDDGSQPTEGEAAGDEATPDGDAQQAGGQDSTTAEGGDDEPAQEDPSGEEATAGLGVPVSGTYSYASGGSWSLDGGGQPEEYQLPATSTGTVEVAGDTWQLRRAAGDRYADRFGFVLGPDGGLDWTAWVLERQFQSGASETVYECSGDSAYYRPDEQGRVATHVCQGPGITSEGRIEHLGREEVTLGDGTVVQADRLAYAYTISGDGASGEGQLDLWLDPATGLRVREQRTIRTTTTNDQGTAFQYSEDVEFTLASLDPA